MADVSRLGRLPHLGLGTPPQIGETVTVDIKLDLEPFMVAMRRAAQNLTQQMNQVAKALKKAGMTTGDLKRLAAKLERERALEVAGLQARYYVRGGLDSRYAEDSEMCALVRRLLRGEELPGLSPAERAQVATGFIIGWTQHQGKGRVPDCGPDGEPVVPVQRNGVTSPQAVVP